MREQTLQAPRSQKYHRVTQAISTQLQLQFQTCKIGNQVYTARLVPIFDLEKVLSSIYIYLKTALSINTSFHKQKTRSYLSNLVQTFQQLQHFNIYKPCFVTSFAWSPNTEEPLCKTTHVVEPLLSLCSHSLCKQPCLPVNSLNDSQQGEIKKSLLFRKLGLLFDGLVFSLRASHLIVHIHHL